MNFLEELNEQQRAAVEYVDGASLVIAGAGSGKTRVLTYKIAYLMSESNADTFQPLKPWQILALTFTNKAAQEMRRRIASIVGEDNAKYLYMGTFHSIFSRILRREAAMIGFDSNFTIYDESDSRSLLKNIIKQLELDDKQYKPATVHNAISMAKNNLITAHDYANSRELILRDKERRLPAIFQIYLEYQNRLKHSNAMDFDDLLLHTYFLFKNNEDKRVEYSNRFQYVLVDEYQDTNYAQQKIVFLLTKDNERVCVVGDDAQSIYAFRGANIDNILSFQSLYSNVKLFKLEQNYRSTKKIVQAANSLIKKNQRQIPKDIYSNKSDGEKIVIKKLYSDKEEAAVVCKEIERIRKVDKLKYNDFAILYRTNAQSRSFEEQLRKMNIPYTIYGGLSFFQRKEIKDVIAYFRLAVNFADEEAFRRVVNYPTRGIGATTLEKIYNAAIQNSTSLWNIISNIPTYLQSINSATANKISNFRNIIESFSQDITTLDAYELGKKIIEQSGIHKELYLDNSPEGISRQENLQEFLSALQDFVLTRREEGNETGIYLPDYLQEVALLSDLDSDKDTETERVLLMTIHSAKGLEFPAVFIVGMEENIFPSPQSANSLRELEEERRLLYVAITRAERHCILTSASSRYRYGRMEFGSPSRFLKDIDKEFVEEDSLPVLQAPSFRHHYEENYGGYSSRNVQNSRPVASQFMADRKPKITKSIQKEIAQDPLTSSFRNVLRNKGTNLKRVDEHLTKGNRMLQSEQTAPQYLTSLKPGVRIEHDRFGIGIVEKVEGNGENTKATVNFTNIGTKQLLLKFARFRIVD